MITSINLAFSKRKRDRDTIGGGGGQPGMGPKRKDKKKRNEDGDQQSRHKSDARGVPSRLQNMLVDGRRAMPS